MDAVLRVCMSDAFVRAMQPSVRADALLFATNCALVLEAPRDAHKQSAGATGPSSTSSVRRARGVSAAFVRACARWLALVRSSLTRAACVRVTRQAILSVPESWAPLLAQCVPHTVFHAGLALACSPHVFPVVKRLLLAACNAACATSSGADDALAFVLALHGSADGAAHAVGMTRHVASCCARVCAHLTREARACVRQAPGTHRRRRRAADDLLAACRPWRRQRAVGVRNAVVSQAQAPRGQRRCNSRASEQGGGLEQAVASAACGSAVL